MNWKKFKEEKPPELLSINWKRIARFPMTKTEILSLTPLRNGQEAMKMENGEMELPV